MRGLLAAGVAAALAAWALAPARALAVTSPHAGDAYAPTAAVPVAWFGFAAYPEVALRCVCGRGGLFPPGS